MWYIRANYFLHIQRVTLTNGFLVPMVVYNVTSWTKKEHFKLRNNSGAFFMSFNKEVL